ncbi:lipase/acyltransferase domain-containing protein [Methylobacterium platani]|uniref:Lecithin:cholesterol acyltransferase n=1 Tax=Methylobacterium platani TaxID=427683 RepID=A0A179SEN3_9HYPH|nr:hypothetical protein [Methylobacterium platani]OAS26052.1 hypothetical protein A5481_06755 [Methylobacterium platani]
MDVVVVIPGIMGSALATPDGVEIWPPTPAEATLGYRRIDQLIRRDLKPTKIIDRVCVDIYGSLLEALDKFGYKSDVGERRVVHFAYDWRKNLLDLGRELDATLAQILAEHGPAVKIRLLCHSMGGLLARVSLERPRATVPGWAAAIDLCAFMATPHEGAPLAVARAAGVGEGTSGLSPAQLRQLAGQPGYPAGYQLFPLSTLLPIWRLDSQVAFEGISVFDPALDQLYGFNKVSLQAAKDLQATLDHERRPGGCRYFSIVSAFHETVTRFDLDAGGLVGVSVAASGDGTVPIRSASALPVQTAFVSANHLGVAQDGTTHELLAMLLGVKLPEAVAAGAARLAGRPRLSVSLPAVNRGDPFEVVLAFGAAPRQGRIVFLRRTDAGPVEAHAIPLAVGSAEVRQVVVAGPTLAPGVYSVEYVADGISPPQAELVVMTPGS